MATRNAAQTKSLESMALAASSKSDGMRSLFEAGYSATEVKAVFGAPYGFVYGVGVRGGFITPTPKSAAAPKAKAVKAAPAKAAKAPAKAAVKAAPAAKAPAKKAAAKK